jgi:hypothetical protein
MVSSVNMDVDDLEVTQQMTAVLATIETLTATVATLTAFSGTATALDVTSMLSVAFTIPAEDSNTITVAVAVTGAVSGTSLGVGVALPFYVSSDTAGQVLEAGTDLALTAGTDGLVILSGGDSKVYGHLVTETTGEMDFVVTDTGTDTYYLNVILPNGRIVTSSAITLAA